MIEYITPRTFLFATQCAVFSVLLFIFFIYYRTFYRKYVMYWLVSIASLCLGYLVKAFIPYTNRSFLTDSWQVSAELFLQLCQYLFVFFLVLGVFNAKNNKVYPKKVVIAGVVAVTLLSFLATVPFAFDSNAGL